jgi:elongation factor 1-alpha
MEVRVPKHDFTIADGPGHRDSITGTSWADFAVLAIDATRGGLAAGIAE